MRLRAHLLWTVNPLLLWDLVAAGHVDMIAVAAGLVGLLAIGRHGPDTRTPVPRLLAAGALIGIAADVKIDYILFGICLAWALRRSVAALAIAACGALAVLVPTYAWLGAPAARALLARRDALSADNFYQLFSRVGLHLPDITVIAILAFAVLAALLLRRLPPGDRLRPAVRPALALALAWLFIWPYQLPWYDAMIICVLVLYPATRLDWLVLARLTFATISNLPGNPWLPHGHALAAMDREAISRVVPLVLRLAVVALIALAVTGRWGLHGPVPGGQGPGGPALPSALGADQAGRPAGGGQPRSTPGYSG